MLFNRKHGDLGMVVLPMALLSIFLAIPFAIRNLYAAASSLERIIHNYLIFGFRHIDFDIFFFNMNTLGILSSSLLLALIVILALGKRITSGKWEISGDFIFLMLYTVIAPFWLGKAIYNNVQKKQASWR
jgi:hypothetical protein